MHREQLAAAARPISARRARYLKFRKNFSARRASLSAYLLPHTARRVFGEWLEHLFDRWLIPFAFCWIGIYTVIWLCVYQFATIELNDSDRP
jgi:hypothetical protein